jgi:hypothetical protein
MTQPFLSAVTSGETGGKKDQFFTQQNYGPIRLSEKSWLKVLFADSLREKNTVS